MRFPLLALVLSLLPGFVFADTAKPTTDPYYMGVALVDSIYDISDSRAESKLAW